MTDANKLAIEADQISKRYGEIIAVNDVSFRVTAGEIVGFLGPNGAGKTTTMRILTGFISASGGQARIAGFDVFEQASEVKRRIGYLPEHPPLYPEMKVRAYLRFVARIKGIARRELPDEVDRVMARCGISTVAHRLIGNISKGYKQRTALAQALLGNPPVLILDEPTVGLDPGQVVEVRELIRELRGNHTIILSTHILSEVTATCDRAVVIHRGQIVADGTFDELEQTSAGQSKLLLEIAAPCDNLEGALADIEGVRGVTTTDGLHYSLTIDSGRDLRPAVVGVVAQHAATLLELRIEKMSLEDIFLRLTAN